MTKLEGWEDVQINDWNHFTRVAGESTGGVVYRQDMIFRGQAQAEWALQASLTRIATKLKLSCERAMEEEQESERYFKANAPTAIPPERWALWAVMQHYRTPTRLLDWTLSPYVAAYFAVREDFHVREKSAQKPGVVWACNGTVLKQRMPDRMSNGYDYIEALEYCDSVYVGPGNLSRPVLWVVAPILYDQRMSAQQGVFTLVDYLLASHHEVIAGVCGKDEGFVKPQRWVIAHNLKKEFLRQLHVMNIHAQSLFPGLDGVGDASRERVLLRMGFKKPPTSFYINRSRFDGSESY